MSPPRGVISVAELSRRLRGVVERASCADWVQGEVQGLRRAASGHTYFTLKDEREDALVDCVMYRAQHLRSGRTLADGRTVQLSGRATVWAPRGRLQFVAESARPVGRGLLLEALERLKARLAEEGLFRTERKRPLPTNARCIGVVTSAHGAAWHDIRVVALRRGRVKLILASATVQGDSAPLSIVRALDLLERHREVEAIIVGRGGGSLEDLMSFNDERVVRRLAACRVPTVSAVGHEIDTSLCDLVADARAATPSEAAERLVADAQTRERELASARHRLERAMLARLREDRALSASLGAKLGDPRFLIAERQQSLDDFRFRLERRATLACQRGRGAWQRVQQRLSAQHPRSRVARQRAQLSPLAMRLRYALASALQAQRADAVRLASRLEDLSPLAVLGRGYAIVLDDRGALVRESRDLHVGAVVGLRFHRGEALASVTRVIESPSDVDRDG